MIKQIKPISICDKCGHKEDAEPDYYPKTSYIGGGIPTTQYKIPSSWLNLFGKDYCSNCKIEIKELINSYEKDNNN